MCSLVSKPDRIKITTAIKWTWMINLKKKKKKKKKTLMTKKLTLIKKLIPNSDLEYYVLDKITHPCAN